MLHISRPVTSDRTSFRPPTRPFAPPSAVRHAVPKKPRADSVLIQRATYNTLRDVWTNEFPVFADMEAYRNDDILSDYLEAQEVLPYVDFMNVPGSDPHVDPNVHREDGRKTVKFDRTNPKHWDPHFFIATIIHELIHVSNALKYQKNLVGNHPGSQYLNLHLPEAVGEVVAEGLAQNQLDSLGEQVAILNANWADLINICEEEYREIDDDDDEKPFMKHVRERIIYGGGASLKETDTACSTFTSTWFKKTWNTRRPSVLPGGCCARHKTGGTRPGHWPGGSKRTRTSSSSGSGEVYAPEGARAALGYAFTARTKVPRSTSLRTPGNARARPWATQ
jgi:hypothetical protein